MFMFWSKRAILTRRLLKAKVREEHETECEAQEDTATSLSSRYYSSSSSPSIERYRNDEVIEVNQHYENNNNKKKKKNDKGTTPGGSTNINENNNNNEDNKDYKNKRRISGRVEGGCAGGGSRGQQHRTRFNQGCCGGDISEVEEEEEEEEEHYHREEEDSDEKSASTRNDRLTRCKQLLKSLKENQLEMLLNVVESYGAEFGSCILVSRKSYYEDPPSRRQQQQVHDEINHEYRRSSNSCRRSSNRHVVGRSAHVVDPNGPRCHLDGDDAAATAGRRAESPGETETIRIIMRRREEDAEQDSPRKLIYSDKNIADRASRTIIDRSRRNNHGKIGRSDDGVSTNQNKRRDLSSKSSGSGPFQSTKTSLAVSDGNQRLENNDWNSCSDPHLVSCKTWRWPDLANSSELKKLPVCHSATASGPIYVCCNPYHWSRLCKPESPPPPYCLIPDRLRPEDSGGKDEEMSGNDWHEQTRFGGGSSLTTTNGQGGDWLGMMEKQQQQEKEWCTLAYWELGGRVGRLYPVEASTVNVFDSLHDGDGLCLATLAENRPTSSTPPAVQRTRRKIGLGLMLSEESDGVWAYNRSESPIFVNSPTLDDPESRTLLVYRVPPGYCLNIFERTKRMMRRRKKMIGAPPRGGGGSWSNLPISSNTASSTSGPTTSFNSGPVDVNSVRISFAKGWGPKYSRQEVTSCPCWLEVLLSPCR